MNSYEKDIFNFDLSKHVASSGPVLHSKNSFITREETCANKKNSELLSIFILIRYLS